jgi:hypothetical protein
LLQADKVTEPDAEALLNVERHSEKLASAGKEVRAAHGMKYTG